MLGDASSNVHMQYLREGVLMTEAEENKLHQTSFIKVSQFFDINNSLMYQSVCYNRKNRNIRC
jgi:hypothetical protein